MPFKSPSVKGENGSSGTNERSLAINYITLIPAIFYLKEMLGFGCGTSTDLQNDFLLVPVFTYHSKQSKELCN